MNDKLLPIFARRSIRKYTGDAVSDELVNDLLKAAMAAPSACAKDPWRFIIVRDREMLAQIASGLPNGGMLADADVGLVVCGDIQAAHANELSYMIQDCSAAIENILLAASMLGLGACWLGVHPREDRVAHITKAMALPENVIPISAIAIGWPVSDPGPRTRYKDEFVRRESW